MEAVITVIGRDAVGILAKVCAGCAECNVNVEEVTQRILRGTFAMIMLVDLTGANVELAEFAKKMAAIGAAWRPKTPKDRWARPRVGWQGRRARAG